jgi:N-methylhydantoinase A
LWQIDYRLPRSKLSGEFKRLERQARQEFSNEGWRGAVELERSLDLRYRGQGYEINVAVKENIAAAFHEEHQRRYAYHHPNRGIELVTLRLRARLRTPAIETNSNSGRAHKKTTARVGGGVIRAERMPVLFQNKSVNTPVLERADIIPGKIVTGPAVITEYSATTVVLPGRKFWIDAAENLVIRMVN